MKKNLVLFVAALMVFATSFTTLSVNTSNPVSTPSIESLIPAEFAGMSTNEFLSLTPREFKKMTGEKLSIKEAIALKAAQKQIKKHLPEGAGGAPIEKNVYIILAIFISFVAVGLATDWKGNDWIINLVLSLICWIPGVIHAFIKMKNYNLKD